MKTIVLPLILIMAFQAPVFAEQSEVVPKTGTTVVVRENPKTGKSFVSVVDARNPNAGFPFHGSPAKFSRPDYRMLDPNAKRGEIPYDGPYSDRRKVYYFAAGLATAGVLAGTLAPIAPAAAAGAGAGAGGLGYGVAGVGVATGTIEAALHAQKSDREDSKIESEVIVHELNEKQ